MRVKTGNDWDIRKKNQRRAILKKQTPQAMAKDQRLNIKQIEELKIEQKLTLQEDYEAVYINTAQMHENRENNLIMNT